MSGNNTPFEKAQVLCMYVIVLEWSGSTIEVLLPDIVLLFSYSPPISVYLETTYICDPELHTYIHTQPVV